MYRLLLVDGTNRVNVFVRAGADSIVPAVLREIRRTAALCGGAVPIVCWDHPQGSSRRRAMFPAYKHKDGEDPLREKVEEYVRQCVLAIREHYCCWWDERYEADDLIATAAKLAGDIPLVIHSNDGDMSSLLANDFRMQITSATSERSAIKYVGRKHVEQKLGIKIWQFTEYRALVGDSSDNLPGVVDIGKETAVKILGQFDTVAEAVRAGEGLHIPEKRRRRLAEAYDSGEFDLQLELCRLWDDAEPHPGVLQVIQEAALPLTRIDPTLWLKT